MVGLSKILDYLIDNLRHSILSDSGHGVKRKAVSLLIRFQIGNVAPALFAKNANKGRAPVLLVGELQERVGSPRLPLPAKGIHS
jgi:hypothetical protein